MVDVEEVPEVPEVPDVEGTGLQKLKVVGERRERMMLIVFGEYWSLKDSLVV